METNLQVKAVTKIEGYILNCLAIDILNIFGLKKLSILRVINFFYSEQALSCSKVKLLGLLKNVLVCTKKQIT